VPTPPPTLFTPSIPSSGPFSCGWRREPLHHGCAVAPSRVRSDSRARSLLCRLRLPAPGHHRRYPHHAGFPATRLLPGAREERKIPQSAASSAGGGRGAAQWISPPQSSGFPTTASRGSRSACTARAAPPTLVPRGPLRLRRAGRSACAAAADASALGRRSSPSAPGRRRRRAQAELELRHAATAVLGRSSGSPASRHRKHEKVAMGDWEEGGYAGERRV
jgi:hypothetical protein